MVAPTRTPQARGVKCDLCKKILASATWLDQTKPAKEVDEAQSVLSLIKQHNNTVCPCIPKNIENLLIGSTHFEIHRLLVRRLDLSVEGEQYEASKQKTLSENTSNQNETILNDCNDCSQRGSRFKTYSDHCYLDHVNISKQQLTHLRRAIDYWKYAMDDQTNPFNAKLALRLGLTHHVIYACYLFKYNKILDYQLVTANLLLNVFRMIEGVTANAILHAYFLLIRALIDCDQLPLARQQLRQSMKMNNYQDKTNYESILLNSVACELSFMDGHREGAHNILDELSDLVTIKEDDKLQHYYARTLAMSTIVRYIHQYAPKSDNCFEFFHTFRYICAMIRRCYEAPFELVLAEKDSCKKKGKEQSLSMKAKRDQILDHSWIRFAICDFVFNTFELIVEFYVRAGMPECLELLYNGLRLIPHRNGCYHWQSRILSIGVRLDLLCDKYSDAKGKLDVLSKLASLVDEQDLMNVTRLNCEVGFLEMIHQQNSNINVDVIHEILDRIKTCGNTVMIKMNRIELYDAKSCSFTKIACLNDNDSSTGNWFLIRSQLGKLSLTTLRLGIASSLRRGDKANALELVSRLEKLIKITRDQVLEFYECQMILEALLPFAGIEDSERIFLDAVSCNKLFIRIDDNKLSELGNQLSNLTLNGGETVGRGRNNLNQRSFHRKRTSRIPTSRRTKRKGTYEVAIFSEKNSIQESMVRMHDILETVSNFEDLTSEELVVSYLRISEPNPHYELYRRAHELMLTYRLSDNDNESVLYHLAESVTANTMRYRWMMSEEQSMSPFDNSAKHKSIHVTEVSPTASNLKHLGFCNILTNQSNLVKSMVRSIPDDVRLVQFKYIYDKRHDIEHLLCVSISNNSDEHIYVHTQRSLASDDFYNDAQILSQNNNDTSLLTIPNRLAAAVEESRKSLLIKASQKTTRFETRQRIESTIGVILQDIENEWLKAFRFLFCGKISNPSYNNLIQCLVKSIHSHMSASPRKTCRSLSILRMTLENAPLLCREEFCQIVASLYDCNSSDSKTRDCYSIWLDGIESHIAEHMPGMNKISYLEQLQRGQIGLILDNKLEVIPFESLPVVRILGQGIFRVPSLRLHSIMSIGRCWPIKINPAKVAYILDPAHNLIKTRERFDNKLRSQVGWQGTISHAPETEELESWLSERELYIFIGHGAGTAYYNRLCKGKGLSALNQIKCASIVMGCSSGRMLAEGPRLETFGVGWMFLFKGGPCYVGLLWDVTDCDIDKFLDDLLDRWLPITRKWSSRAGKQLHPVPITEALVRAKNVCQLKYLVGSTPVVYGLPIWCLESC